MGENELNTAEVELKMLAFMQLVKKIITSRQGMQIFNINLTKVAENVGLKRIPTQQQLYDHMPSGEPKMEDAIRLREAMLEDNRRQRAANKDKKAQKNTEIQDELEALKKRIAELETENEELKEENKKCAVYISSNYKLAQANKDLLKERDQLMGAYTDMFNASQSFAKLVVRIQKHLNKTVNEKEETNNKVK